MKEARLGGYIINERSLPSQNYKKNFFNPTRGIFGHFRDGVVLVDDRYEPRVNNKGETLTFDKLRAGSRFNPTA